jgi:DNA-binding transcriptional ArsR family regulator
VDRVAEIVEKVKAGEIDERHAIELLENDYRRKERRFYEKQLPCGNMNDMPDEAEGPEEIVVNRETQRAIVAVINELPKQQAKCVEMYYFRELTVYEIADSVGISVPAVSQHLVAARKNIARIIDNDLNKQSISTVYGREENSIRHLVPRVYRKYKLRKPLKFPFQIWRRFPAPGTKYGYVNLMRRYLADCFHDNNTRLPHAY